MNKPYGLRTWGLFGFRVYDFVAISEFIGDKMTKAAPVALVLTIFVSEGAPGLMVMADYVRTKFIKPIIEGHKAEGHAEGRAEGIAEGRAEGMAEGRAEGEEIANERSRGWYERMLKARENDEPFDEPPPF